MIPNAACMPAGSRIGTSPFFEARLPVGSSADGIEGRPATARATATPPPSAPGERGSD